MHVQPYSQRVVAGTPAQLAWQLIGGDGEPVDPGTVTVTVTRADGTELVTDAATDGTGDDARTFDLTPAQSATLDRLSVAWVDDDDVTLATTEVDVVAAPYFSNAELRTAHSDLESVDDYTVPTITRARLEVEAFIESVTHRRFVPGYTFDTVPGSRFSSLLLPNSELRRVRSVTLHSYDLNQTPYETFDDDDCAAIPPSAVGLAHRADGGSWSARWVRIGYEHGFAAPPADVKAQAMLLCRHLLVARTRGNYPDNATSITNTELGWSAILVTPGVRGAWTSIPSVNECLDRWTYDVPEIGGA